MSADATDVDELFDAATTTAPAAPLPATAPSAENRRESRVRVGWPARVLLPNGLFRELRLHDLSASGVGLAGEHGIPANSVLTVAIAVPGLNEPHRITPVVGTIKTTHMTVRGALLHCGGVWVTLPAPDRELLTKWIRKLAS